MRMGRSVVDNCSAMARFDNVQPDGRFGRWGQSSPLARHGLPVPTQHPLDGVNTPWQDATVEPIFQLLSPCPPTTRTLPLLLPI